MHRITRFILLTALAVGSLVLSLWMVQPELSAEVLDQNGNWVQTSLPWQFHEQPEERWIRVHFHRHGGLANTWRILPDDQLLEMRANGQPVSLEGIPEASLHDWSKGFSINLGAQLKAGENVIELHIHNSAGPGGANVRAEISGVGMLLIGLPFLIFLLALNAVLPLAKSQRYILALGLVALLSYWSVTPPESRTHDAMGREGHFGYASYIADNLALPRPNAGWTYYHPPLYYVAGAVVLRGVRALGVAQAESLQLFSLGLWLVFLCASAAALRSSLRGKEWWLVVATCALVLWPSGIIHSIRIGNDVPTYAACALATYCMVRWWKRHQRGALIGLALWCVVALLCKTSAIAIVAAAGTLLSWRILFPGHEGRLVAFGRSAFFGLAAALGLLLSLSNNIYYYLRGELSGWLVGNVGGLDNSLRVPVTLKAFIPLDIPTYLTSPWVNAYDDATGRYNFWNYLLRNSLSGEFGFDGTPQLLIAYLWGAALLILIGLSLKHLGQTLLSLSGSTLYRLRPVLLLASFWLLSLIALRIQAPFSCSNDFRYIVPILFPAILLAVHSGRVARWLLLGISLSSVFFFTTL